MQGIYLIIWSKPEYETFTSVSIPKAGVSRSHQNVPHKSDHRYTSTPDSSGLRGLPNRTPLRSDQALPKCPTSPSDTLKCAAPAHLRTTTDLQNGFHFLYTEHFQYIKISISKKLWQCNSTSMNNTFYRL